MASHSNGKFFDKDVNEIVEGIEGERYNQYSNVIRASIPD